MVVEVGVETVRARVERVKERDGKGCGRRRKVWRRCKKERKVIVM